ncbi:hypothetical protein [Cohnella faecalis]|nr:hypothetical protein [Cohnella faecalis]
MDETLRKLKIEYPARYVLGGRERKTRLTLTASKTFRHLNALTRYDL